MSEFANKDELEKWLVEHRVTAKKASVASSTLFGKGYDTPLSLLGITIQELKDYAGIEGPAARELSNALRQEDSSTKKRRMDDLTELG